MRLQISIIIQEIIDKYNMKSLVDANGWFYMKTSKGMYGLKQGGIISHCKLIKHLAPYVITPFHSYQAFGNMIQNLPYLP